MVGKYFGRWIVIKRKEDGTDWWYCECKCKNKTIKLVRGNDLRTGKSKSCCCLKSEVNSEKMKKLNIETKRYNIYNLSGEYGVGYTFKGEEFYFDLDDYNKIKDYCWFKNERNYICAYDKKNNNLLRLHRVVTNCPDNLIPDHIGGESTRHDNRKCNLRICTNSENQMNVGLRSNNTSKVTGVHWHKRNKKWVARIMVDNKRYEKSFDNFNEAVKQRKIWEEKYFGIFSYNNSQKILSKVQEVDK